MQWRIFWIFSKITTWSDHVVRPFVVASGWWLSPLEPGIDNRAKSPSYLGDAGHGAIPSEALGKGQETVWNILQINRVSMPLLRTNIHELMMSPKGPVNFDKVERSKYWPNLWADPFGSCVNAYKCSRFRVKRIERSTNAANILITYLYWYDLNSPIWRFIRNTYGESPSLHSHAGYFPLEKTQNLAIQNAIEDVSSGVPWVSNLCDRYHPHQTLYQRCFIFFHGPTTCPLFIFLLFWLRLVRFGKPPAHQGHHMFLY